jgi:hypothetical protein
VQGLTTSDLDGLLAVVAVSEDVTGKVKLELEGPDGTFKKVESSSPYAVFGDRGDVDFFGETLDEGSYTFTATTGGVSQSVDFDLIA